MNDKDKNELLRAVQRMSLSPISTAPRDGRIIIVGNSKALWFAKYKERASLISQWYPCPWRPMLGDKEINSKVKNIGNPTHWMPYPNLPKE